MWPARNSGSARRVTPGRGNDATRRSAVRLLSVEAVEFSPALSSGAGGVVPTVVAESPLPTAGRGGDVQGGSGGAHVGLGERRG